MAVEKIRESVIAGTWYSSNPDRLVREIRGYLQRANVPSLKGRLIGLIAPHAGYMYSGPVAAHAYKTLEGRSFKRVVVVAPSHRAYFSGASIYHLGGYRTPLGVVPLDRPLVDALMSHKDLFAYVPQAHAQEHSLEIQLPFLQVVLGDFQLTPILMGDVDLDGCRRMAEVLAEAVGQEEVLLVASTDLSHYYSYEEAKRLDRKVLELVERFDPEGLYAALKKGECEACGSGPMVLTLFAARALGATKARVLHYANSGDVTGDTRGVVGYMAAALLDNPGGKNPRSTRKAEGGGLGVDLGLSVQERAALKEIAWQALRHKLRGEPEPRYSGDSEKLREKRGAFVTLHKGGALRGCIGYVESKKPLWETVKEAAIQAALADPRFPPVRAEELEDLDLEISALTPLERLQDPMDFEVGRHGLLVRHGFASGLLLPQVAVEHGWDREEFLRWTCKKAGLPENAWKDPGVEIYRFSADVF